MISPDTPARAPVDTAGHPKVARAFGFTDAVVAVAITLLVLPLVDDARTFARDGSVGDLIAASYGDIIAFAVSFLVIFRFWAAHRRMVEPLLDFDEGIWALTGLWLLLIVFLPFPTARLFAESRLRADSVVLYLCTELAIGVLGLALAVYVWRHPALRRPGSTPFARGQVYTFTGTVLVFVIATVVAVVDARAGLFALLLLPAAKALTGRVPLRSGRAR